MSSSISGINSTRKKGSSQIPQGILSPSLAEQQQLYQIQQQQIFSRDETQQQQQQPQLTQQFSSSGQFKSPNQNQQSASKYYPMQQQSQQQQNQQGQLMQQSNNNSSINLNRVEYFSNQASQSSRQPIQSHRQLITAQAKTTTPRAYDIKGNNFQTNQQYQKFMNTALPKTPGNVTPSNGIQQNVGQAYQINPNIQQRPQTASQLPSSAYRSNTQEGDLSQDLIYLGQYNQHAQYQQKQADQQSSQTIFQDQNYRQHVDQQNSFSPQKYLVNQQGYHPQYYNQVHTEGTDVHAFHQNNQWQQQQQTPLPNGYSQNSEALKAAHGSHQTKQHIGNTVSQQQSTSFSMGSQINPQQQLASPPLQNVTKILKLLDYLMHKNLIDEALDVFWEFAQNTVITNPSLNSFSELFHERNKVFVYASRFYSYISNGEVNQLSIQGGFVTSHFQTPSFSQFQSPQQFQSMGPSASTIYQGNLNFGSPSFSGAGSSRNINMNMGLNGNMLNSVSQNNSSYTMQQQQHHNNYLINNIGNSTVSSLNGSQKQNKKKRDIPLMMETFQICMERIIEENEIYRQQYGMKYPQSNLIVFDQKITYLNNLAVFNMKKHNYALSFEQFGLIEKYSRLSNSYSQKNEQIKQLSIQSNILNNVALSCILLEDWNQAEALLQRSIGQQEVKVFPNIKNIEIKYLQEDTQFLTELSILVFGYVYAELVKRVKTQLKLPSTSGADMFYIKNALSITRKYFGSDHAFNRKIQQISKLLDSSVLYSPQSQSTNTALISSHSQGIEEPDLFDSQPLGQSLAGLNNNVSVINNTTNNNTAGLNPTSQSILPCIFLILKECQFELNHTFIYQYRRYVKFRRANFDKELTLWKHSMESSIQNNYQSINQSSTRITNEASSFLPVKKNNLQDQSSEKNNVNSQKKEDKNSGYDAKRSSSHSLQMQNSNRDFNVSQNGANAYFLPSHTQQQSQQQQQKRQITSSRKKGVNQSSSNVQQNSSAIANTSHSHLNHRQYVHHNQQSKPSGERGKITLGRPQSTQQKKNHQYPTNESLQDPNDQSEPYYESEEHEEEDDEYPTSIQQAQRMEEVDLQKNRQSVSSKEYHSSKNTQPPTPSNNNNQQNSNSKRINTKRVQSEYFMKKHDENAEQGQHQQQQQLQQSDLSPIPSEKLSNLDENLKTMIIQVINQNEQIKKEKQSSAQEITQLKQMLNNLIDQQKQNSSQIQQQQQQLIENQMKQLQKLEKERADSQNSNKNNSSSTPRQNNNRQDNNQNTARSPFFSSQSPITPPQSILQLLNILNDTPYVSFSLSKQIYPNGTIPYTITSTLFKSGQLEIKAESQNQVVATEQIFKDQLMQLLCKLNYHPTLPISLSLNMCQNIYLFNKCFILPFTFVDPEQKEIKFLSNAPGLLSNVYERTFLGEKTEEFFHHIEGNIFRIVLSRKEKGDCIKIDIEMDAGSQKKWVEWINDNDYPKDEMDTMLELTKESTFQRNEFIKEMQQRNLDVEAVKKFSLNKNSSSKVKSFKILSEATLMKELDEIIDQIQELFVTHKIQDISSLLINPYFLRVKIWSIGQKRQIHLCIDNPKFIPQLKPIPGQVAKPTDYGEIKVILKNIYQTFGAGGEKLRAQGVSSYSYYQVQSMYSLKYQNLHLSEKICILSHLPDYFLLNVHEKYDETLQNAKSTRQSENPIVRNMHMSGAYSRILHKYTAKSYGNQQQQEQQYPITFEVIGANSKLLGIRVSIYNYLNGKENGFFLQAEDNFWLFQNKILVKNAHHMYLEGLPLSQFFLPHIFEEVVVPLIQKHISIYEDPLQPNGELYLKIGKGLITQNSTSIYRIENIITVNEILKNYPFILSKSPQ